MENQNIVVHSETIHESVRAAYSKIASQGSSCCGPASSCCGSAQTDELAESIGYSAAELSALPDGANLGLSCGNPTAFASLKPGETVLDLGCGGGFDVFISAVKVGAQGRIIGVDMTPEMIAKARGNIPAFRESTGLKNVDFRLGEIEHLPVADASVDVVISNCVINLSPDKPQVWSEVARVLKPGGRVSVSDLALLQPLPKALAESVEALVGCFAGAVLVEDTRKMLQDAGLVRIELTPKSEYIESMSAWNDPLYQKAIELLPEGARVTDYLTSLSISTEKPR